MSNEGDVFAKEDLYSTNQRRVYPENASEVAFPIGGIGTGSFSIGPRGEMKDWEIFNRPGKGNRLPYTFFAIHAMNSTLRVTKVLEARRSPPYSSARGYESNLIAGLPRFDSSSLTCDFPFYNLRLKDTSLPLDVTLEAYNPFIPLNSDDSGLPGGVLRYRVTNTSDEAVQVSVVGSLFNPVGFRGYDIWKNVVSKADTANEARESGENRGVYLTSRTLDKSDLTYGNMSLITPNPEAFVKPEWLRGQWLDCIEDFWNDLTSDGKLEYASEGVGTASKLRGQDNYAIGSVGLQRDIRPGETAEFEFVLTWFFPNRAASWEQPDDYEHAPSSLNPRTVQNYYSSHFTDSWDVGLYFLSNRQRLREESLRFSQAFLSSTLPDYVLDAAGSNLSVLKSATCFRIADGTMLAYEGCHDDAGCCPGTCTHVWNYAQAVAFLFPDLERSMRRVDFLQETDEQGLMQFRGYSVLENRSWGFLPAVDGQMGTIMRLYREWMLSGDDAFLQELWPKAKKALDFAERYWDEDGDGVLNGRQHVDYDIEFYGPNPLGSSCYYGALKAAVIISNYLGDDLSEKKYANLLQTGSQRADELLWNGEYYVQRLSDINEHKYQVGEGCLADQLFGQYLANVCDLGYIFPEDHVRTAMRSIFKYNFRRDFFNHESVQRTYVLNDEKGLLLTSWPFGGKPRIPFIYSNEVWSRIEYHVAATLIQEGLIDEGLTIVKAVRDRYDGYRRNPWDEFECGHHYSGTLSSWSLITALSGFRCNNVTKKMSFEPKLPGDFRCFWSNGKGWGVYETNIDPVTGERSWRVDCLYGTLEGVDVRG